MKITFSIRDGMYCLSSEDLGVFSFGETIQKAKINFLKSCKEAIEKQLKSIKNV